MEVNLQKDWLVSEYMEVKLKRFMPKVVGNFVLLPTVLKVLSRGLHFE